MGTVASHQSPAGSLTFLLDRHLMVVVNFLLEDDGTI